MENTEIDEKKLEKYVEKLVWKETMFDADYDGAAKFVRPIEEEIKKGGDVEYCKGAFSKFKYWQRIL